MDTLRLYLEAPAFGGYHIAHEGVRTWFVRYGATGETMLARVRQQHDTYGFADAIEIVESAPERVPAPCPYFGVGRCGGCQLQHLSDATQLAEKQHVVAEQLRRVGKFTQAHIQAIFRPIVSLPARWHYRTHITYHIGENGEIGFIDADEQHLYPVETCLIVHPDLAYAIRSIRALNLPAGSRVRVHRGNTPSAVAACLVDERGRLIRPLFGDDFLSHQVSWQHNGRTLSHLYRVRPHGFFQVNADGAALLVEHVMHALDESSDNDKTQGKPYRHALDLYAGVGLFSLFLSERAAKVTGFEIAPNAVEDARENAKVNTPQRDITFHAGSVETLLKAQRLRPTPDLVVLDPPRAGVKPAVIEAVAGFQPHTVVYVSCDPTTLARDLKAFVAKGYTLHSVQPVDLFPQTYHIEAVALLTRSAER